MDAESKRREQLDAFIATAVQFATTMDFSWTPTMMWFPATTAILTVWRELMDKVLSHLTEEERKIEERANAATEGPWFWRKCYEMGSGLRHWALKNVKSESEGRVINLSFISFDSWSTPAKWRENPDVVFIEKAREDIPTLLSTINALRERLEAAEESLEGMVQQFAYEGSSGGLPAYSTGGLSALEDAFRTLGWADPKPRPELKCQVGGLLGDVRHTYQWHGVALHTVLRKSLFELS